MIEPDVREDQEKAYWVFAGAAVISLLAWFIVGASSATVDREVGVSEKAVRSAQQTGTVIDQQIELQKQANEYILRQVEALQEQHGLRPVQPFIQAQAARDRDHHLKAVYDEVRERMQSMARSKSLDEFDSSLGFAFPTMPPRDQVPYWLTMLQLTTKAGYLSLACPYEITKVNFGRVNLNAEVLTGPAGRPALLREYPFEMEVTGSLKAILWLIHELSADSIHSAQQDRFQKILVEMNENVERVIPSGVQDDSSGNAVSPLIIRGFEIESSNLEPIDQITQMTVKLQLAGMEFLEYNERFGPNAKIARMSITARGGGGNSSGSSRGGSF